jgi:hypothetical protein
VAIRLSVGLTIVLFISYRKTSVFATEAYYQWQDFNLCVSKIVLHAGKDHSATVERAHPYVLHPIRYNSYPDEKRKMDFTLRTKKSKLKSLGCNMYCKNEARRVPETSGESGRWLQELLQDGQQSVRRSNLKVAVLAFTSKINSP